MSAPRTLQAISEATAFDNGERFTSVEQLREYFSVDEQARMFGACAYTQDELDAMAAIVLDNRWHFEARHGAAS